MMNQSIMDDSFSGPHVVQGVCVGSALRCANKNRAIYRCELVYIPA